MRTPQRAQFIRRPLLAFCGLALLVCLASPQASAQEGDPLLQGKPYVPRYQGPYNPASEGSQQAWGFSLLGAGALSGGVGLLLLDGEAQSTAGVQIGTGLLVAGVFMSGLGIYTLVSATLPTRTILTAQGEGEPEARGWTLDLIPTQGGALLHSSLDF